MSKPIYKRVFDYAVEHWMEHETGTDSLTIASELNIKHDSVKKAMLRLEADGHASLNKNCPLAPVSFCIAGGGMEIGELVDCHVIFPKCEALTDYFHSSGLARLDLPVYKERILKGAHSYSFTYFNETVLTRYLNDPRDYEVTDSRSGGQIQYQGNDEHKYIYVRHGRRRLVDGRRCVVAFLVDMKKLSESEQRYWHGYELDNPEFSIGTDGDFARFLEVNLDGAWVGYEDPLKELLEVIRKFNDKLGFPLLQRDENQYAHAPVVNTEKAYCEACAELYKLLSNDNLVMNEIKKFLMERFHAIPADFFNKQGERAMSQYQLLQLVESRSGLEPRLTKTIKSLSAERQKTAHTLNIKGETGEVFIDRFFDLCKSLTEGLNYFSDGVSARLKSGSTENP